VVDGERLAWMEALALPIVLSKTYDDALRAAGAPEDKARAAAEELASLQKQPFRIAIMRSWWGMFSSLWLLRR